MSVVAADLERSGLFRPVDKQAFIQDAASLRLGPRFGDWRLINAEALVSGNVELQADGRMQVQYRLWDVFSEAQIGSAHVRTPVTNERLFSRIPLKNKKRQKYENHDNESQTITINSCDETDSENKTTTAHPPIV